MCIKTSTTLVYKKDIVVSNDSIHKLFYMEISISGRIYKRIIKIPLCKPLIRYNIIINIPYVEVNDYWESRLFNNAQIYRSVLKQHLKDKVMEFKEQYKK